MAGEVSPLQLTTIELDGHESGIRDIAFSSDGLFATSSDDRTVRLWNPLEPNASRCLRGHSASTLALAFSLDGTILASSSANEVILTAVATGEELVRWAIPAAVGQALTLLRFNSDGSQLAGAISNDRESHGSIVLWDAGTGRELVCRTFREYIKEISFDGDGNLVADTYEASDNVRVYRLRDVARDECKHFLNIERARAGGVPYRSPTGRFLALGDSCYGSSVEMFDINNGVALYNLDPPPMSTPSLSFSPDGSMFAWGNKSPLANSEDCRITIHDADTGHRIGEMDGIRSTHSCSFSPDGRQVCAVSMSESGAWFWDCPSGNLVARAPNHRYSGLFFPDCRWFVSIYPGILLSELPRLN